MANVNMMRVRAVATLNQNEKLEAENAELKKDYERERSNRSELAMFLEDLWDALEEAETLEDFKKILEDENGYYGKDQY